MSKYYDSRGRCFSTLSELQESTQEQRPSLLSWGATFREIVSLSRVEPPVKKDQDEGYQKATTLPRSEYEGVFNDTRKTILPPDLLGTREVAALLNVSQRTVQRLGKQGALPTPVGGSSRRPKWLETDILEFRSLLKSE